MFNIYLAPPRALERQGVSAFIRYKMCIHKDILCIYRDKMCIYRDKMCIHKNKIYLVFFRKMWYYKDMKGICLYGSRSS